MQRPASTTQTASTAQAAGTAQRRDAIRITAREDVPAQPGYPVPHCSLTGARASWSVCPPDESLWLVESELAAGAELEWTGAHGDEAVYVAQGALDWEGRRTPERGAVILESGARGRLRATEDARVIHVGPTEPLPPPDATSASKVHVVGPGGTFAQRDEQRDSRFFADSTCASCRIFLLYTSRSSRYTSEPHSHSQDELIYLLWGSIRVAGRVLRAGASVFIRGDQPYGFVSGPEGFGFLNYRRDASRMTYAKTGRTIIEGGLANGFEEVRDLR